jgi:hypothetical protein
MEEFLCGERGSQQKGGTDDPPDLRSGHLKLLV